MKNIKFVSWMASIAALMLMLSSCAMETARPEQSSGPESPLPGYQGQPPGDAPER